MVKIVKNLIKKYIPYSIQRRYHKNTSIRYLFQKIHLTKKISNTPAENLLLNVNNPDYTEIYDRYFKVKSDHSFWIDWFDDSDFKNFKGENVFVTQLAGLRSIKKAYENTVSYAIKIDELGLMGIFDEDRKFGVESVKIGKESFSRDRVDSVIEINYFSRLMGITSESELRLVDIGAGYGRLASRVLQAFPNAYVFCGDVVPQATFLCNFYLKFKGFNSFKFKCGSYDELTLEGTFDIAVNIHSFSEAPLDSIKKWLDIVSSKTKYIFIVPSGDELASMEYDGSRLCYMDYLKYLGYQLVNITNKYGEELFEKNLCLSPAKYYYFKKKL